MGRGGRREKRTAYRLLVEKRLLGRPRRRSIDNINMDLKEIGWGGMDWICLAQGRVKWSSLMNAVMKLRVPIHAIESQYNRRPLE
jgi:hypothetical protein